MGKWETVEKELSVREWNRGSESGVQLEEKESERECVCERERVVMRLERQQKLFLSRNILDRRTNRQRKQIKEDYKAQLEQHETKQTQRATLQHKGNQRRES